MPCPGGISVGIRSSFCWLYCSSSQLLHAFVVSSMLWYQPSPAEVLALSLILLVTLCGLWSLAKIYFCRVVGMIIRWALVNIPSSLPIWSLKGQFGFKSVGCCWMWVSNLRWSFLLMHRVSLPNCSVLWSFATFYYKLREDHVSLDVHFGDGFMTLCW